MFEKPKKVLHDEKTREKIYEEMLVFFKKLFDSDERIKEIRIYGSGCDKAFGKYVSTYKPGTPTSRDFSDIDTVFLIEDVKLNENNRCTDKLVLGSGHIIETGRFIKDDKGNIVSIQNHPVNVAPLTTPQAYYEYLNTSWPKGFDFSKEGKVLFKRK